MANSDNYIIALNKLKKANTRGQLLELGIAFTELYSIGAITEKELLHLDMQLIEKLRQ